MQLAINLLCIFFLKSMRDISDIFLSINLTPDASYASVDKDVHTYCKSRNTKPLVLMIVFSLLPKNTKKNCS